MCLDRLGRWMAVAACSLAWGCGSGWYVLSEKVASPPPETSRDGGYLTGTVDVRNREVLLSPEYQLHASQRVQYLLVTAQYVPPGTPADGASREPEIPVLLLDAGGKHPQIEDPRDLDVISRYPLRGPDGSLGRMAFRIRVLREDPGDVVLKVWSAVTAVNEITEIDPTGTLSLAGHLMGALKPFLADEPHTQVASFQVDKVGDGEMAAAWVVLPTDPHGQVLPSVRDRWKALRPALNVCQVDDQPWLCRGGARLEGFPYLIVRYRRDDYRSDPDLLSRKWSVGVQTPGACPAPGDASDWVFRAWAALNRDVWSPQQREVEKALLRANHWCLNLIQGPLPATGALGLYLQCQENLPARLPANHPLAPHVDRAARNLELCVRSKASQIEGFDAVSAMIETAHEIRNARMTGVDPRRLPLPELKSQLRAASDALQRVQGLGVERARWTREVATWREELEKALYLREFAAKVDQVAAAREPAPALVQDLERLAAGLAAERVECTRCRDEVRHARDLDAMLDRVAQVPGAVQRVRDAPVDAAHRETLLRDLNRLHDRVRAQHDRGTYDAEGVRDLEAAIAAALALPLAPPTVDR